VSDPEALKQRLTWVRRAMQNQHRERERSLKSAEEFDFRKSGAAVRDREEEIKFPGQNNPVRYSVMYSDSATA